MSTFRSVSAFQVQKDYITLDTRIILDARLSIEGKAAYAMFESGGIEITDIPERLIKELIEVGALEEVSE
jgi:hypothetical protein